METGRVYFRDEDGRLMLAVFYEDEHGNVTTIASEVESENG